MVDLSLARKANEILERGFDKKYHVSVKYIRESEAFDGVKGKVIYVGSGVDLSTLFLFENASTYIYQDLVDCHLPPALRLLAKKKIISDLKMKFDKDYKRESTFRYKGKPKRLVEVHGGDHEFGDPFGSNGDIAFNIPNNVKSNLNAIYFRGMPYPESIRVMQINLLPLLKIGGVFEGPYPYADGRYEGAQPEELGLARSDGTFVKSEDLSSEEISRIIRYSVDNYIEYLLDSIEGGFLGICVHSKMKHKQKERQTREPPQSALDSIIGQIERFRRWR